LEEKKTFTLDQIREDETYHKSGYSSVCSDAKINGEWVTDKYVAIRKQSSDGYGDFLVKLFEKVNGHYVEIDLKTELKKMADYLAKSVTAEKLIREVIVELDANQFFDLKQRIEKEGKVTVGVRKGSCVFLHIRGKQGKAAVLQLTD